MDLRETCRCLTGDQRATLVGPWQDNQGRGTEHRPR